MTTGAVAAPVEAFPVVTPCRQVLFVGARGSGQPLDGSAADDRTGLGPEVYGAYRALKSRLEGRRTLSATAVIYPAQGVEVIAVDRPAYFDGLATGVGWTLSLLQERASSCPGERLVLAGYSQGAMVMHRVIQQLSETEWGADVLGRLDGVVLIADGDRLAGERTVNSGTAGRGTGVGQAFASLSGASPAALAPALLRRVHSICDKSDPVCDFREVWLANPANWAAAKRIHTRNYRGSDDVRDAAARVAGVVRSVPVGSTPSPTNRYAVRDDDGWVWSIVGPEGRWTLPRRNAGPPVGVTQWVPLAWFPDGRRVVAGLSDVNSWQRIGVVDTVRRRVLHERQLTFNSAAVTAAGRVVAFQDAWQGRPAVITLSAELRRIDVTRAPRIRAAVGTDAQLTWIAAASNRGFVVGTDALVRPLKWSGKVLWLSRSGRFRVLGPAGSLTVDTVNPSFTRYAWATGSYDTCRNNDVYTVDLQTGQASPVTLPEGQDVAGSSAYFQRITDLVYTAGDGLFVRAGYTPGGLDGDYECLPTARLQLTLLQQGGAWTPEWTLQGWPITGWTSPGQLLPAPGPQPIGVGGTTSMVPTSPAPVTSAPPVPARGVTTAPPTPPSGATIYGNPCSTAETAPACSPARISAAPTNSATRIGDVAYGQALTARCWVNGQTLTDGNNADPGDDAHQFTSSLWFGVDWGGGRGYVSAVWTTKSNSTLGLPGC